jgi:defect-in-organelle-trafficking protein DotC
MKQFVLLFMIVFFSTAANAKIVEDETRERPPEIEELINIPKENKLVDDKSSLPLDIKLDAQKEAALSYGARGGLAWRTFHIRNEMETRARYLDKVFDFRELLIPAPSGLLIEPPVVSEAMDAMIIDGRGMEAAVADRVLNINKNARIVSTARTWRAYLEREWGEVEEPPDILRPETKEER